MPRTPPPKTVRLEGHYRIAAVSALTGIPVPTIRIWEYRYAAVKPERSSGNGRLYTREDVDRLLLLKATVDAGYQIGSVAALDNPQLRERLNEVPRKLPAPARDRQAVLVCGETLGSRLLAGWKGRDDLAVTAVLPGLDVPPDAEVHSAGSFEVLIVEQSSISPASLQALRRARAALRPSLSVVVYGFANRRALAQLDEEGVIAVNGPSDPAHLARICRLGLMLDDGGASVMERLLREPAAPQRFDAAFLAHLRELPTQVQCECPTHLADLLSKLNAFEQYSLDCEHRSEADSALHGRLHAAAAHCREMLEHALHQVLLHEGIEAPGAGAQSEVAAGSRPRRPAGRAGA